MQFSWCFDWLS